VTLTVRGPVDVNKPDYVHRPLDDETITAVLRNEFVVVTGARQTGKTTLAMAVRAALAERGIMSSYVDVTPWEQCSGESEWLALFVEEIRSKLLPADRATQLPGAPRTFAELPAFFLTFIALTRREFALVLDEISGVPQALRQQFFTSLRVLFNERSGSIPNKAASKMSILFLGSVDLLSFIPSGENSPFNVAKELDTIDFDFSTQELDELCSRIGRPDLSGGIHRLTSGHPYLSKRLIELAGADGSLEAAEAHLWSHTDSNLTYVRRRVDADDSEVRKLLVAICGGQRVKHVPSASVSLSRLVSLGIVKGGQDGYSQIRCDLYQRLFASQTTSVTATPPDGTAVSRAVHIVSSVDALKLSRYRVVGDYIRYDEATRNALKNVVDKVARECSTKIVAHANYLIWASPGTGKTYFVEQIAKTLPNVRFLQLNLAQAHADSLRLLGREIAAEPDRPTLSLVDEIDAPSAADWSAEAILPVLDLNQRGQARCVMLLVGSTGERLEELEKKLEEAPKGRDMLSRVPGRLSIPPLELGDQLVIAAAQLLSQDRVGSPAIREIERLALVYLTANANLASSRRLADFCVQAVARMGAQESRLKFDHLFDSGDPENKSFWLETTAYHDELINRFVTIERE
jgi:hypothetical protein